jgi:hypothetical protein
LNQREGFDNIFLNLGGGSSAGKSVSPVLIEVRKLLHAERSEIRPPWGASRASGRQVSKRFFAKLRMTVVCSLWLNIHIPLLFSCDCPAN